MHIDLTYRTPCNFLSFTLGNRRYLCDTINLQEIKLHPIVNSISWSQGFAAWKHYATGANIPVIDLLFRTPTELAESSSSLIILTIDSETVGIIVDEINDIIDLSSARILPVPPVSRGIEDEYLLGMVEYEEQDFYLIDLDRIFSTVGPSSGNRSRSGVRITFR